MGTFEIARRLAEAGYTMHKGHDGVWRCYGDDLEPVAPGHVEMGRAVREAANSLGETA